MLQNMECKKDNCLVITLVVNRLIHLRHIVRTALFVQPPASLCGRTGNISTNFFRTINKNTTV